MPSYYAIRWDVGAYDEASASIAEVNTLRQPEFHGRAPWFAVQTDGGNSLSIVANQATMNQEVVYANSMGLTGWAFLRYINVDPVLGESALTLFKAVPSKGALKWVSMEQAGTLGTMATYTSLGQRLIAELGLSYYGRVTVASVSRPLLYFFYEPADVGRVGTLANIATQLAWVRSESIAAGHGNPYIVVLYWNLDVLPGVRATLGADAIGAYVPFRPYSYLGPYSDVRAAALDYWEDQKATTEKMVPTGISGWSPLPRLQRPVPWETSTQRSFVGHNNGFVFPTDAQLAAHLGEIKAFLAANATACPADTALIYSWNEHGEGGRPLCPSRDNVGTVGTWAPLLAAAL